MLLHLYRLEIKKKREGGGRICEKGEEWTNKTCRLPGARSVASSSTSTLARSLARPCPVIVKRTNERTCSRHAIRPPPHSLLRSFPRLDSEFAAAAAALSKAPEGVGSRIGLQPLASMDLRLARMRTQRKKAGKEQRRRHLLPEKPFACSSHCTRVISSALFPPSLPLSLPN